ncbi:MAG: hypothetical protein KatS3mg059_0792 [Thermomicrobiales bacterium]|nr:MAG: hypothetical protein KatS3mg059_0792 [Thermomicrobiales bacterium]
MWEGDARRYPQRVNDFRGCPVSREPLGNYFGLRGGIMGLVVFHEDDGVADIEIVAAAADDKERGDRKQPVQLPDAVDKWRDGLLADECLHARVTHKEGSSKRYPHR